ncbi:MAG TPA: outer membrane protein transport protein [Noviherbaspirillum sp.]|uniref:OmpP1/FadL family transporter n=1 Tax=Noviherbaspirillum sp. TaxID=1926288 RepID=UPI002B45CB87|nr:outer membrane protein transport protein [Noviherbaspirillum sp.]HJV84166.1 outer membrane protein transport protein [Noviherbaspirillum sp.]
MRQIQARHLAAACMLAALSAGASATDVFRLEGFGPISRAMGGTATAYDVGASGMMSNPATLSLMASGTQLHLGLDVVTTDIDTRNRATGETASSDTHSKNRGPYAAPEIAYTHRIGPWTLGAGAFAQGGLGTEYGKASFLSRTTSGANSQLENSSRLLVLNIPFAASYAVNDRLSVGGSLDAMWMGLNLDMLLGADQVGALIGGGRINGSLLPVLGSLPALDGAHFSVTKNQPIASGVDAWGVGAKLGLTYKLSTETTLGASYSLKSRISDLEGNATLTAVDRVAGKVPLAGKLRIRDLQMPASLTLGLSQRINDAWMVTADLSRVFWKDVMKNIDVGFEANGGGNLNILLPQEYKDQTILALGTAYRTGNWTLRGGARVASQALRPALLFAVIPATPTKHLSAGFSYDFSQQDSVHLAYSHAFEQSMSNASLPNTSAPIDVHHSQDNLTVAYTRRF